MRVICIRTPPVGQPWGYGWEEFPRQGDVLTVRDITISPFSGKNAYTFQEIRNPPAEYCMGLMEIHFMEQFFRQLPDEDARTKAKKKRKHREQADSLR